MVSKFSIVVCVLVITSAAMVSMVNSYKNGLFDGREDLCTYWPGDHEEDGHPKVELRCNNPDYVEPKPGQKATKPKFNLFFLECPEGYKLELHVSEKRYKRKYSYI